MLDCRICDRTVVPQPAKEELGGKSEQEGRHEIRSALRDAAASPDGVVDEKSLVEETIEQCVLADEVGYDYLWFVEHHFLTTFSGSSCPEVIYGALSRLTKRIRLGFGVVILPHDHPIRVAEKVAMVDQMSDGRVEFGTGRSSPYEQLAFGVDPRDTREIWDESLRMIPQMWQSDEFSTGKAGSGISRRGAFIPNRCRSPIPLSGLRPFSRRHTGWPPNEESACWPSPPARLRP